MLVGKPAESGPTPPGAAAPPGRLSANPFPVTVGGSFGLAFSVFSNLAGVAVDDDGSVYFQQVDLTQFTGGNITLTDKRVFVLRAKLETLLVAGINGQTKSLPIIDCGDETLAQRQLVC